MGRQKQFVRAIQGRHNATQAGKAVGFGALALLLWYVSYWILKMLVIFPCVLAGYIPSSGLVLGVAWGGMVLLAVEGALYTKRLFDTGAFRNSFYMRGLTGTETEKAVARGPRAIAWLIAQILFSAPRSTVHAIRAVRALVFLKRDQLAAAERILMDLARKNDWVPMEPYATQGEVPAVLAKLGVVSSRSAARGREVRITPTVFREYGVPRGSRGRA